MLPILDDYDELPKGSNLSEYENAKPNFIYNLIHHNVLPDSTLVITSRPHVLGRFRYNADKNLIVSGFTEERLNFVKCSLGDQLEKVSELLDYLHDHSTIDNLCSIPFNITVLLYLYKQGYTPSLETLLNCITTFCAMLFIAILLNIK